MKQGRTIVELAEEITRQHNQKRDFVVAPQKIQVYANPGGQGIEMAFGLKKEDHVAVGLTENGHNQLGSLVNIPAAYYDRMLKQDPRLLADSVKKGA